jgi:hypothetical protein
VADMNKVIDDLNRRYNMASEKAVRTVTNRAGNMPTEYIDSAPHGLQNRGVAQARQYPSNVDTNYQNEFVVLTPKA